MIIDRNALLLLMCAVAATARAAGLESVLLAEEMPGQADNYYDEYETDPPTTTTTTQAPRRGGARASTKPPAKGADAKCSAVGPTFDESKFNMLGSALMVFPTLEIKCDGEISEWEFVTLKANTSQLYLAVWHRTNPAKVSEFGLRGMNNPNITALPGKWNKWRVPEDKRIQVFKGDIIGYFYVNWVVNVSELIMPIALPSSDYDKKVFRSLNASVYAAMMGLPEVVQRQNSIIDFAVAGSYLEAYAVAPIRAVITERTRMVTTEDPFAALARQTQREGVRPTTQSPQIKTPKLRCQELPTPYDEKISGCKPERFLRFFYSPGLRTCVFYYFSTCTDIPGRLPAPIRTGNNFDSVEQCKQICEEYIDNSVDPVLPLTDYTFGNY